MNGPDFSAYWQTLQPDWPMLLLGGSIVLLMLALLGFLIAALLLRRGNDRKAREWERFEREWGELVEAVHAGRATGADVRAAVAAGEKLQFVDFLYKQAQRTEDPARRAVLSRLAMPYLPQIASRTSGADPERRARAVKTLAELGGESYSQELINALDDPSPLVAMSAARALAAEPSAKSVREIVTRVDRFAAWNRRFLRATLAQLGPAAIPGLQESVRNTDLGPAIRAVCLHVLSDLGDPEAAAIAGELLGTEDDVDLRAASLRVIRHSGDRSSSSAVRALCSHEDPVIRAQAIGTLARIADAADDELLEGALWDGSPWVALHAARGLKHRGQVAVLQRVFAGGEIESANSAVALQVLREES